MICPSCFGTNIACELCASYATPHINSSQVFRDLRLFGTTTSPLRSSGLQLLCVCPWRFVMDYLYGNNDEAGPAADTGSATHAAVAAWHENGKDVAAAVKAMVDRHGEFPRASLDEAAALFLLYSRDPRNQTKVIAVERKISFTLPPAPEDPTQAPITILGTVDQIREEDGRLYVFDLKTSKRSGLDLMRAHQYQVAAYCIGASHIFKQPVHPGSLICPRHYGRSLPESAPPGVFFPYPWTFEDAGYILWGVRRVVAAIRSGEIWFNGGEHCRWCPAGSPDACLPLLRSTVNTLTMKIENSSEENNVETMQLLDINFNM